MTCYLVLVYLKFDKLICLPPDRHIGQRLSVSRYLTMQERQTINLKYN